jgi:hypothetical protein
MARILLLVVLMLPILSACALEMSSLRLHYGSSTKRTRSNDLARTRTSTPSSDHPRNVHREEWIQNSLAYYKTITRGSTYQGLFHEPKKEYHEDPTYLRHAMENYFARQKIKDGKADQAESIYRKLLDEYTPLIGDPEACQLSSVAVPTLLLGLLLQRERRWDDARTVFESFLFVLESTERQLHHGSNNGQNDDGHDGFHRKSPHRCCCSARVLQAFALFEMKQNNPQRAVQLMHKAIRIDRTLRPVLRWKLFQDAMGSMYNQPTRRRLNQNHPHHLHP